MVRRIDFLMHGWNDAAVDEFVQQATRGRGGETDTRDIVTSIIADVRKRGGEAVADYTRKFDRFEIDADTLTSEAADLEKIASACPQEVKDAIDFAHDRIAKYHEVQHPEDHSFEDGHGLTLGWKWTALESVGVYVPGGRANYPSSVLMNMVPAKVAGVERIVMVAPTPDGEMSPAVAYAALKAGVQEYYPIGGAQAVAALAYGAGALKPVDKIVGPGNAFVAEAKRQVFGHVGIDTIAGPSEVCVISDGSLPADWIIADLLAQAEHDPSAQSILISIGEDDSWQEVYNTLTGGDLVGNVGPSLQDYGYMIRVPDIETACRLANRIAPEHLELAIENPDAALPLVRHAGAVFLGGWTPEALGDYVTGSNHVLPTSGAARFSSGLGLLDFMKRISIQKASREGFVHLAGAAMALAQSEHLPAHKLSVSIRIDKETET
ncbi:MAG: histidinol dehydrogenase [Ponticaulis sp.]|nr:histidinol dehydrogenase [Ponticaulis sp.]|tara:strand:+ start:2255 stop:3562 length:1308 start_codon:yes stop_codon:yes gene_type:complete